MPGELLPPHLPYLPSHVLTYSHLACPWSQSFDRREGHHQVHLLLGICRRAEPPRGSCRRAAPRHAAKGCVGPLAAGRGSLVGGRARVAARAGVRASGDACGRPCRGGRSSCGRPLSCELTRRGRRQGGPVGQPRRPHCGAVSGAWTDAGIGVACAGVAVDPGAVLCVDPSLASEKCNISFIPCLHAVSTASSNVSCPIVAGQIVRFGSLKPLVSRQAHDRQGSGATRSHGVTEKPLSISHAVWHHTVRIQPADRRV